jgi:serine phosphatase RsbU (regulator of sigma subunit)/Tfp pilus assembly protein PilF
MKRLFLFTCIVLSATFRISAQNNAADSLLNIINTTRVDTLKIIALKDLAFMLSRNAPAEAEKYCLQCLELSHKEDYAQGIIRCNNIMGIINIYKTDFASALQYFNNSLEKATEINDQMNIFKVHNNIGNVYINLSDYDNAVNSFTKALAIAEALDDKKSMAQVYNGIAVMHKDHADYATAMDYYEKAATISAAIGDDMLLSQIYSNISTIKFLLKDYKSAIDYCNKALTLQQSINDLYGIDINYANLGEYYLAVYKFNPDNSGSDKTALDSSAHYYRRALSLAMELQDDQRICNAKIGLGLISFSNKDYSSAYRYFNEVVELSRRIGIVEITMQTYNLLADVDVATGNYKRALEHFKLHKAFSDSIYTTENQNSINEMEAKYQAEKKQQEIEILNKEKALESIKNKVLVGGVILLLLFLGAVFIALLSRIRDNKLLKSKNAEIQQQREEIQTQADRLAEANHEITIQKELIEKSHLKITDSITYARYIQSAVMPSEEHITELLPRHFILFKPRDIVSGDFYMIKQVDHRIFIVAADCTGHGVPGAFMSMMGIALLNELMQKSEIKGAAQFLEILRIQIKSAMKQSGQAGEQREGMDIALCIINKKNNELNYAGAYSPLWLFRRRENSEGHPATGTSEFVEYLADRQPAGIYLKEKPFTEYKLQLKKGDRFYIFSDGFYSQFGGKRGEKLKKKPFREIIARVSELPMNHQKDALESAFNQWQGNEIQIDDVLVMGVEI